MGNPNIFQNFLNTVGRSYGQADKNIFGGLLPGGAATPIGAAFQGYTFSKVGGFKPPDPTTRRLASLADAAAGAIANTQPFVRDAIKFSPAPVQKIITSGLNNLPFSVNLFGRYLTGVGNKNLVIPESATFGMKENLNMLNSMQGRNINELEHNIENTQQMLDAAKAGTPKGIFIPPRQDLNDLLAEQRSNLQRMQQGDIRFSGYNATDKNPLTSPATSMGQMWFKPTKNGYQSNETYDFAYGGADKFMGPTAGGVQLNSSQARIANVFGFGMPLDMTMLKRENGSPVGNPLTDFGRAITSKMPTSSFDYTVNIR